MLITFTLPPLIRLPQHPSLLTFSISPTFPLSLLCSALKIASSKVAFLSRATELRAHELRALVLCHFVLIANTFLVVFPFHLVLCVVLLVI